MSAAAGPQGVDGSAQPHMELVFEVTLDDIVEATMARQILSPGARRRVTMIRWTGAVLFAAGLLFMLANAFSRSWDTVLFGAVFALVGVVYMLFAGQFLERQVRSATRAMWSEAANPTAIGRRRLVVDERGITETMEVALTFVAWPGVVHVQRTPSVIIVWVSSLNGFIVPARAFSTVEWADYFVQLCEHYRGQTLAAASEPQPFAD